MWTRPHFSINTRDTRLIQGIAGAALLGPNGLQLAGADALFANSVIGGFVGGLVSGGSAEAGLRGAATAGLFYGAGTIADDLSNAGAGGFGDGEIGRAALHAAAGCASASASRGKCGSGALSAGLGELSNGITKDWPFEAKVFAGAVVGGTGSVIGGGKFSNGALTGAFGYLFNEGPHDLAKQKGNLSIYFGFGGFGVLGPFYGSADSGVAWSRDNICIQSNVCTGGGWHLLGGALGVVGAVSSGPLTSGRESSAGGYWMGGEGVAGEAQVLKTDGGVQYGRGLLGTGWTPEAGKGGKPAGGGGIVCSTTNICLKD